MTFYHGSYTEVKNPDLLHSREDIDFGAGFYLTEDPRMAKKWAVSKTVSVVNEYESDFSKLKVYRFSLDKEWLDFVKNNRLFEKEKNYKYEKYDVIIGPTTDDKLYDSLRDYLDGVLTAKETIEIINVMKYSEQTVLKTQKALDALSFTKSKEIIGGEKQEFLKMLKDDRTFAAVKTLELKNIFRERREKIEQLLDEQGLGNRKEDPDDLE